MDLLMLFPLSSEQGERITIAWVLACLSLAAAHVRGRLASESGRTLITSSDPLVLRHPGLPSYHLLASSTWLRFLHVLTLGPKYLKHTYFATMVSPISRGTKSKNISNLVTDRSAKALIRAMSRRSTSTSFEPQKALVEIECINFVYWNCLHETRYDSQKIVD